MKFLHTMLRVSNIDKSVEFYVKVLGLQLIRRNDFIDKRYTLIFLGYGSREEDILIELTHNWDVDKYEIGTGFGHIAFAVDDLKSTCQNAKFYGGTIKREPGLLKTSGGKDVAFVTDPDNYTLELIDRN